MVISSAGKAPPDRCRDAKRPKYIVLPKFFT